MGILTPFSFTVQTDDGAAAASADIEVRRTSPGTPLASFFTAADGSGELEGAAALGPSDEGYFEGWFRPGEYTIAATTGGETRTWTRRFGLDHPAQYATLAAFEADVAAGHWDYVEDGHLVIVREGAVLGFYRRSAGATTIADLPDWVVAYDPPTAAEMNAAIAAAVNAVETVTRGGATFLPAVAFETPGDVSVVYGATRAGAWRRLDDFVNVSFNLNTVTLTHSTASGPLRVDLSDIGLSATATDGKMSILGHGAVDGLNVARIAFGWYWLVAPGQDYAELFFSSNRSIRRLSVYDLTTDFVEGETVTFDTTETARVEWVEYAAIGGTAAIDQYLYVSGLTANPSGNVAIAGNAGGAGTVSGAVPVFICDAGNNRVNTTHVISGAPLILQCGQGMWV